MGSSAKATRGGNKKRVNKHRQEAKLKAQGAMKHSMSVKDSVEAKKRLKERSQAISGQLRMQGQKQTVVRMAPKPKPKPAEK